MNHIKVNKTAPAVAHADITIKAPIELVWHILTDFENWPAWNEDVSKVHLKDTVEVGNTFVWKTGGSKITSKLAEINSPNKLAWTGKTLGIRAIHIWTLEQVDGEHTHVRTEESFEGFIVKLMPRIMTKMLDKTLKQAVSSLKREAESGHDDQIDRN